MAVPAAVYMRSYRPLWVSMYVCMYVDIMAVRGDGRRRG